ncbi:MAG: peptidylprolyl isomerase [Cryomorphaceae bacterium]|nr:MAG: peptidylprolyl isomerase [Cryomorphaceae bacterium]|tara:strand:- start:1613 stop:2320 length:708 start_codon:yes stop_codon:yes gene_type:complete
MFKFFKFHSTNLLICIVIILISCENKPKIKPNIEIKVIEKVKNKKQVKSVADQFVLNDENAIPFFFEYDKNNKENKVRIETRFGNIDLLLFNETPYHRSNFIYLTKKKYFDGTSFHRVVKDFIIQGGNSDSYEISKRRKKIGRYLLPPDTKKGFKHHRGVISIPSSDIDNPYKLASPYEFFIVVDKNGAYHLDENYTPFGKVINGMNVVDLISNIETDKREWPIDNIKIKVKILN